MTDEQWLREQLEAAVPAPPPVPDRAAAARGRARRRRRRAGVVGVVAASMTIAAVMAGTRTLGDGSGDGVASQPSSPYDVPACPAPPPGGERDRLDQTRPGAPGEVPQGATAVRLCEGVGAGGWTAPEDALITAVDTMVETVNHLPQADDDRACTRELGRGYRLVFTYDDGSAFVTSGGLYGCRDLVVGSSTRAGADTPWDLFIDLLRDQRGANSPPATPDTLAIGCDAAPSSPVASPDGLRTAALCIPTRSGRERRVDISAADLAILTDDMRRNVSKTDVLVNCAVGDHPRIVGADAWGERVVLRSLCRVGPFQLEPRGAWLPGEDASSVLERLLGRPTP